MIDRMSIVSGFISKWGMRIYPKQSEQVIFLNGEHDDNSGIFGYTPYFRTTADHFGEVQRHHHDFTIDDAE